MSFTISQLCIFAVRGIGEWNVCINHMPRFPMDIKDNGSLVILTCEIEYEQLQLNNEQV